MTNQEKSTSRFVALLRGINVGGNNLIKMTELKSCFESMGFTDVITYIQSGNVIFSSQQTDEVALTEQVESTLLKTFKIKVPVVIISQKHLAEVIQNAPHRFGENLEKYRCDVIFLKQPLTANEAAKSVLLKEGVDEMYVGKHVLYFSRLTEKVGQSKLSRIVGTPVYKNMTIRNWNTSTKLLNLITEQT